MTRRIGRAWDRLWWIVALYFLAVMFAPLSWWGFSAQSVLVDARERPPLVYGTRNIWRDIEMSYTVVVRDAETLRRVCGGSDGPFPYRAQPGGTKTMSLVDWAANDEACGNLPPGDYSMTTTWAHNSVIPFFGVRTKTIETQFKVEPKP